MKLLIIDNDQQNLQDLSILVKDGDYTVFTALNGEEGLLLFKKVLPDIVVTALRMQGISGFEVLKTIRRDNPEAEIIVFASQQDVDLAVEALRHGASDFLYQPINNEIFIIALKRAREKIKIRKEFTTYTTDLETMCSLAMVELKRKTDFQDKLIYRSNDGIVAANEYGTVIIFNPRAEQIFGIDRKDVVGKKKLADLYPEEINKDFFYGFRRKRSEDDLGWRESVIVRQSDNMKVPVRYWGTLLYDQSEIVGNVGFFQDLSEIKQLQQELVQSERLAAIGQTVARLAHYIKNILTGLKGGAYIVNIALDKNDTDKLKTGWNMIQRNVEKVSSLVSNLLSYSKEREPEYRDCFPNEIVEEVFFLMEVRAQENNIQLLKDYDPLIKQVSMDPDAIHRILLNLVSNAIDACIYDLDLSKKLHHVWIKTRLKDNNCITFEVTDDGTGMSDEVKKKLFSAFFSTKGGKGTGLGLLVTQKVIQENGGDIKVESQPGLGSTFFVTLPYRDVS